MMSLHLALPHEGHLDQVLQIFAYLKKYPKTKLVYDPSDPTIKYAELRGETGHPQSLGISMERRNCLQKCLNLMVWVLQFVQRLMPTMLLAQ